MHPKNSVKYEYPPEKITYIYIYQSKLRSSARNYIHIPGDLSIPSTLNARFLDSKVLLVRKGMIAVPHGRGDQKQLPHQRLGERRPDSMHNLLHECGHIYIIITRNLGGHNMECRHLGIIKSTYILQYSISNTWGKPFRVMFHLKKPPRHLPKALCKVLDLKFATQRCDSKMSYGTVNIPKDPGMS